MSTPTNFSHFQDLPRELQILIADQLPCDTYLLLLRSSQHTHKLLSNSTYLTRRAAHLSLPAAYHADWRTPLHVAAAAPNLPLLTAILSSSTKIYGPLETTGAVNLADRTQATPLFSAITSPSACNNTRAQTVELLLRYGAKTRNAVGDMWRWWLFEDALTYAVKLRDYKVMRVLLKAGVEPGVVRVSRYNPGPLWMAVIAEDVRAASLLLRLGEWRDEGAWKGVMRYVADRPETADMARVFEEWLGEEKWVGREKGRYEMRETVGYGGWNWRTYDLVNREILWLEEWSSAGYDIMKTLRAKNMLWSGGKHTWGSSIN